MTGTLVGERGTKTRARMSWKRKIFLAIVGLLALLIVAAGALWILKPWVPDIVITEPGPTGERIAADGVFANYFPAKAVQRGPAVMMLGGSEGGIGSNLTRTAVDLQAKGFSVLTPSYFGAPGQPGNLELVPLETFDRALAWLRAQGEVDPKRIAVVGHSKGAEAALLVGLRDRGLRAVVASAPSSYVWPGIDWSSLRADASWTSDGEPLDVLPYGPLNISTLLGDIGRLYEEGLEKRAEHPAAAIAVERIEADVLLLCGELDSLWPSCPMAEQIDARASDAGHPSVRVLAYEQAGHRVFGLPEPAESQTLSRWGGPPAGNNAARRDAWPKVVEFLRRHLERTG